MYFRVVINLTEIVLTTKSKPNFFKGIIFPGVLTVDDLSWGRACMAWFLHLLSDSNSCQKEENVALFTPFRNYLPQTLPQKLFASSTSTWLGYADFHFYG